MSDAKIEGINSASEREILLEGNVLLCPSCGGSYLHHGMVHVHNRTEEDGPGLRTVVFGEGVSITPEATDFIGRRDDLRIFFGCEGCTAHHWLCLVQHKGQTFMIWRDAPPIEGAIEAPFPSEARDE
ncbi:MAG: hypothetical protein ACHREM_01140 [Polyangiales bacterium]